MIETIMMIMAKSSERNEDGFMGAFGLLSFDLLVTGLPFLAWALDFPVTHKIIKIDNPIRCGDQDTLMLDSLYCEPSFCNPIPVCNNASRRNKASRGTFTVFGFGAGSGRLVMYHKAGKK